MSRKSVILPVLFSMNEKGSYSFRPLSPRAPSDTTSSHATHPLVLLACLLALFMSTDLPYDLYLFWIIWAHCFGLADRSTRFIQL